MYMVIGTNMK